MYRNKLFNHPDPYGNYSQWAIENLKKLRCHINRDGSQEGDNSVGQELLYVVEE